MSRILLAWELGRNFGHLATLLPLARHLRQQGHTILFAIKETAAAGQLLAPELFNYLLSPCSSSRKNRLPPPDSFADILARAGFGSSEILSELVRGWRAHFNCFQPDVLVAQYAPVAQFAARLSGLPCLQLNTGFEYPPDARPYPCFRPQPWVTITQLLAREEVLLKNINTVSGHHDKPPLPNLQEALKGDIDLLVTLPELDHYPGRRNGRYIGPISHLNGQTLLRWSGGQCPRIFVYLRPFPGIELILETLAGSNADVIAYIPGIDDRLMAFYANGPVRISSTPVNVSQLLPEMDLTVSHAGHGVVTATLLAGVPMLMLPRNIEQWLLSTRVVSLGAGIGLPGEQAAGEFPGVLARMLTDRSYRVAAKGLAQTYAGYNHQQTIERIANTIDQLPTWPLRRSSSLPRSPWEHRPRDGYNL
jgi:UDP:flavonoid glycosyltransferase YjiC (YdhE family)